MSEVLASGKLVFREECSEGSQTAKSGIDEQKRDMRHGYSGKQAQGRALRNHPVDDFSDEPAYSGVQRPKNTKRVTM